MVTFGVPIREQGCTTKEGNFGRQGEKESSVVLRQTKRGAPSRSQVTPLGRTCAALRWIHGQSWASFSWDDFGEVWKHRSVGGMCEAEPKSVKSVEMKRQQVCG
jgi:hypothetical protein